MLSKLECANPASSKMRSLVYNIHLELFPKSFHKSKFNNTDICYFLWKTDLSLKMILYYLLSLCHWEALKTNVFYYSSFFRLTFALQEHLFYTTYETPKCFMICLYYFKFLVNTHVLALKKIFFFFTCIRKIWYFFYVWKILGYITFKPVFLKDRLVVSIFWFVYCERQDVWS